MCVACCVVDATDVWQAIWQNQFYYLFGILFIVLVVFGVACAEISIVTTYMQLCAEARLHHTTSITHTAQDHRWWWPSFISAAGVAVYMLLYAVYYFLTKMRIVDVVPALLYFGYSTLMAITFFILAGPTSLCFVNAHCSQARLASTRP